VWHRERGRKTKQLLRAVRYVHKAAMILRMLNKRYGDQRFIAAPSLRSATHNVPQKDHAVAEPVLVDQFQLQRHTVQEEPFSGADDREADEHLNLVNQISAVFCNEAQHILIENSLTQQVLTAISPVG
jgi:hypothetical protein